MKPLTISVSIEEGPTIDFVTVTINDEAVRAPVPRDEYVESRWGRFHNAKSRVRHLVSDALLHWNFAS